MSGYRPYQYLPLEGERTIRLLILQPAKKKYQALCADIVHVSLGNPPFYEGLSYTWNNETPQLPLICQGGTQILITPNCAAALQRLRRKAKPRSLWVDVICIDQATGEERNAQVMMMADIYRNAAYVAIWLGPGDPESDIAFKYLRRAYFIRRHDRMEWLKRSLGKKGLFSLKMLMTGCTPQALASLADRSYWTRVWTLQEFAGSIPIAYCGDNKPVSAIHLIDILDNLSKIYEETVGAYFKTTFHSECLQHIQIQKNSLAGAFSRVVRMSASDPRDKIYALKGLFPQTLSSLEVNYNKSPQQISLEATQAVITNDQSLTILTYLSKPPGALKNPSWVVDWGDRDTQFYPKYKASKASRRLYHFPSGDSSLILYGRKVDTVGENVSLLLPAFDFHNLKLVHNGYPISITGSKIMLIQAVCGLYDSRVKTIFSSFPEYFRSAMQFLLSEEEDSDDNIIDSLLTFDLEQGELPSLDILVGIVFSFKTKKSALFITTAGKFGLAREGTCPGDTVVLFSGLDKPFIVRPTGTSYFLICPAIISGMMDGELWPSDDGSLDEFRII